MKVIDTHVHIYPDKIAGSVTVSLAAKFGNPPAFTASADCCRDHARRSGVSLSINLPVATAPAQVAHTNAWAARLNAEGGGLVSLASLHPDCANRAALVAEIAAAGFKGIKFHPEYQKFRFNEPRMDEVWSSMSDHGLIAYLHAGGERVFEPPFRSSPSDVLELQTRFPGLKIAAAHLGGFGMWEEAESVLCGSGVYLDLSHALGWAADDQVVRIVRRHGAQRVLFGSDAPWQDPADVLARFLRLPFSDDEREDILHRTAERLFRLPPSEDRCRMPFF